VRRRWSERWSERLESLGYHLSRKPGRRSLSLEVDTGRVRARFKGRSPAEATLEFELLSPAGRTKLVEELGKKARYAAGLLAGRLPEEVEIAFAVAGRALLPSPDEPRATCTCVEPPPCHHILLVLEELGRRLDDDPFLLLALRGLSREELLGELRAKRGTPHATAPHPAVAPAAPEPRTALPVEELPVVAPELFFKPRAPLTSLRTTFAPPEHGDAVLTRLGPPPLTEPEAANHLIEMVRAIGLGAKERLAEWEWRRSVRKRG